MLRPTPSSAEIPTSLVCNNLSVSILIDDKPVEMYKVQVKGNKATCYIESIEGKEFKIRNKMVRSFSPQVVAYFGEVDGSKAGSTLSRRPEDLAVIDGPYISAFQKRPLMFSKINLTDDADLASNDEKFIKNLGSIQVMALRGMETGHIYKSDQFDGAVDNRAVDERSKKANVSHQVRFGAAKSVAQKETTSITWTDYVSVPDATFGIKYLSRNLLELQNIVKPLVPLIDHDASPSTSSSTKANSNKKRKASNFTIDKDGALVLSDDSDDERKAMNAKIVLLEAENKRLKRGGEIVRVKEEKGTSKVKVKKRRKSSSLTRF